MAGDRWTFLLVTDEESPIRQYDFSPRAVYSLIGGLVASLLVLSGLGLMLGATGPANVENARLERENLVLAGEIQKLRGRVAGLEGTLSNLAVRDARYRLLAGLDRIDEEVLQVGVGGPGLSSPEAHALWQLNPGLGKETFALDFDLHALERRARLLEESLAEATDSLVAHRDLLESTPSILPTPGLLSSRFSRSRFHPIHHQALPHEGVDLSAPAGTPIMAAARGRVTLAGRMAGYGLMVELDHGYGYVTRYGHASKALVRVGQTVSRGDVIAQVGKTGIATSPHLHYEVRIGGRPVNPLNYVITGSVP